MADSRDSPTERVARAHARVADVQRPEVWITLRPAQEALADASAVADRLAAGEELPLAGLTLAVTDDVDVAGLVSALPQGLQVAHAAGLGGTGVPALVSAAT